LGNVFGVADVADDLVAKVDQIRTVTPPGVIDLVTR
jgi:hypothetical protein